MRYTRTEDVTTSRLDKKWSRPKGYKNSPFSKIIMIKKKTDIPRGDTHLFLTASCKSSANGRIHSRRPFYFNRTFNRSILVIYDNICIYDDEYYIVKNKSPQRSLQGCCVYLKNGFLFVCQQRGFLSYQS